MPKSSKAKSALLSTKDAALAILSWTKESSDVLPPLKAAVGCALFIAETVDTFHLNKIEWREPALPLASMITDMSISLAENTKLSTTLDRDIKAFTSELISIENSIKDLSSRSLLDRITQAKGDPIRIASFRTRIILSLTRFTASSSIALRQQFENLKLEPKSKASELTTFFFNNARSDKECYEIVPISLTLHRPSHLSSTAVIRNFLPFSMLSNLIQELQNQLE